MSVLKSLNGLTACCLVGIVALSRPVAIADEGTAEVAKSREVLVGQTRVVLLRVNRVLDFAAGDDKRPAAKALAVWYLCEQLDDTKIGPVQNKVEVFAAGTTDPAFRFLGKDRGKTTNGSYADYEKQGVGKLPTVKAKDRGVILSATFPDIEHGANRVDLKLTVGLHKGEDHTVWFKGIALE